MKKLIEIQNKLKVPKDQRNNFGNFNYRSAEAICEKVKPICQELGCLLFLTDDLLVMGSEIFVRSTAIFTEDDGARYESCAFAKIPFGKKGMDDAQATGVASSYARKYALCALFLIDGGDDPDAMNAMITTSVPPPYAPITPTTRPPYPMPPAPGQQPR